MEKNKRVEQVKITQEEASNLKSQSVFMKIWKDSVASKLIARAILFVLTIVTAYFVKIIETNSIVDFFKEFLSLQIKLSVLLMILIVLIIGYFIYLKIRQKLVRNKGKILTQQVGNYLFRDLNNILLTTKVKLPDYISSSTEIQELDLLTLFKVYMGKLSMGIDWNYPGEEGVFLYHTLGPQLICYGLCEKVPSLDNNTSGNINSYDIQISENGYKFFALLESYDRIENLSKYENEAKGRNQN